MTPDLISEALSRGFPPLFMVADPPEFTEAAWDALSKRRPEAIVPYRQDVPVFLSGVLKDAVDDEESRLP